MNDAAPERMTDDEWRELRRRIADTRPVRNPWGADRSRGVTSAELDALLAYWAEGYDRRPHEARIAALPWMLSDTRHGPLRCIHQVAGNPKAPAVVLLHGWPDSVLRFERLLPRLGDLHVVVPALPGFPFAPPSATAASAQTMADMVSDGMAALGHERYVVSGGDVGGTVAEHLAAAHPDRVSALHLSNVSLGHVATVDATRLPPAAAEFVGRLAEWRRTHGGFVAEQSTRPSTLIAALGDSPAGLLAWIGEKLLDWSDRSDGPAFSPDELLTWVTAYWSTGTIGTSFSSYVESAPLPDHLDVPTVMSSFALDIVPAPRSFAELFVRVEEFVHHDAGGHFAAWERPDLYEADLRRAVALGRS